MALQVEARPAIQRHAVTLDEYERMVEAGVFEPEARLELITGEIVDMAPPGPGHAASVSRLHQYLGEQLKRRAIFWPQGNPIRLPNSNSRPQPDMTLLRWRDDYYATKLPGPEDVLLLVEVSDSTLKFDRGDKLQLYAEAGIPEYWIVNLVDGVVEAYSDPNAGTYQTMRTAQRGETLLLPGGLEGNIQVADIVGEEGRGRAGTPPEA